LIFVGPPDARTLAFASGKDPRASLRILAERKSTEAARLDGIAGIVEVDGVGAALLERIGKIEKDSAELTFVFERRGAEKNPVDREIGSEVELDAVSSLSILKRIVFLPRMYFFSGSTRISRW